MWLCFGAPACPSQLWPISEHGHDGKRAGPAQCNDVSGSSVFSSLGVPPMPTSAQAPGSPPCCSDDERAARWRRTVRAGRRCHGHAHGWAQGGLQQSPSLSGIRGKWQCMHAGALPCRTAGGEAVRIPAIRQTLPASCACATADGSYAMCPVASVRNSPCPSTTTCCKLATAHQSEHWVAGAGRSCMLGA